MPSTKISRDKKFLEITILAEKYHWKNKLHPLPCGSPYTYYRFIIMFIIVVVVFFLQVCKDNNKLQDFAWGNWYFQVNNLKMSTTSLWINVHIQVVIDFEIRFSEMHPINTNGMDFELNKTPVNYCSKLPPMVITQTCTPQPHDSKSCRFIASS
jgi:hypothetical protein